MKSFAFVSCPFLLLTLVGHVAGIHAAQVAYWNLNEAAGNIADGSGNGQTGVASATGLLYGQSSVPAGTYGALTIDAATAAAFGTAIDFNKPLAGSFAVAATPLLESLFETAGANLTIMAWVRTDALPSGTTYRVFATGPTQGWGFGMANVDRIRFTSFGFDDFTSSGTIATNSGWHHIAVTIAGTAGTMYADGNSIGTFTYVPGRFGDETQTTYRIGSSVGGTSDLFDGQIDELKIFDTALTQAEVRTAAVTIAATIPEPTVVGSTLLLLLSGVMLRRRIYASSIR
ncbi:MAG: LamG domain-containing protein [Pirellulales bacterium]